MPTCPQRCSTVAAAMVWLVLVPSRSSAEPAAVSDEELATYLAPAVDPVIEAQSAPDLHFYGFADFQGSVLFNKELGPLFGESPEFTVGNFNLYMAAEFNPRWRSLSEVRFTFLPNGSTDSTLKRISTTVYDNANIGARMSWGGISIQRVWLEYSPHALLTIRAGYWLTPVGIWNVDHGTPTIIPAFRPYVISLGFFPEQQSGIEIYGSQLVGETTLGYHLTISNGRGLGSSYLDLDKNKALGGRVYAKFSFLGALTVGASIYGGKSTDANVKLDGAKLVADIEVQFDELAIAADVLWQWKGIHLQAEGFGQSVGYTEGHRPPPNVPSLNGGRVPDHQLLGAYALLGYRLSFVPLLPFIQFEYMDWGGGEVLRAGARRKMITYAVGLNYRPLPNVTLKAEFYHLRFLKSDGRAGEPTNTAIISVAWSF